MPREDELPARVKIFRFFSFGFGPAQERKLDRITTALADLTRKVDAMAKSVQEVLDSVTATSGKVDSLIALTGEIKRLLDELRANPPVMTPEQQAILDAAAELSDTSRGKVEAAINANDEDPNT